MEGQHQTASAALPMEGFIEPETLEQHDIDRIEELTSSPSKTPAGDQAMQVEPGQPFRARVFALLDDGCWEDIATGIFIVQDLDTSQVFKIAEEIDPNNILYEVEVLAADQICLQNEMVLGWKLDNGRELAISFELASGLTSAWHHICAFQKRPPEFEYFGGHVKLALPISVDSTTIPLIEASLNQYQNFVGLRKPLVELILENHYVPKLVDQFKVAVDLENSETVEKIFSIFRCFVFLASRALFDAIFTPQNATAISRIFEHDPALVEKPKYHEMLEGRSLLPSLGPFAMDTKLSGLVRHTFRVQYFKDVILPRYVDDEAYSVLTMMVRSFYSQILDTLDSEPDYYAGLVKLFQSEDPMVLLQAIKFFKEFVQLCKTNNARTLKFFTSPALTDLLRFIRKLLDTPPVDLEQEAAAIAAEVLLSLLQIDQYRLQLCVKEEQSKYLVDDQLMTIVINRFHQDADFGVRWHLVNILRTLLDPPNPAANAEAVPLFEAMNDYFYAHQAYKLLVPFTDLERMLPSKRLNEVEADRFFHLCELSSSFVLLHKYKIKYLLVRDHILNGIALLMISHQAFVKLASLRLFRTLLSVQDAFYHRAMLSSHVFERVLDMLQACKTRNNLLRAAILDFFVAIHGDRSQLLIDYLVPKFREELEALYPVHEVFNRIVALYDSGYRLGLEDLQTRTMGEERRMASGSQVTSAVATGNWEGIDIAEEDYFTSEDSLMDEGGDEEGLTQTVLHSLPPMPLLKASRVEEVDDDGFGGALGGDPSPKSSPISPAKPAPLPRSSGPLKLGLKIGSTLTSLWKAASATSASTTPAGPSESEMPASPNKKSKA